MAVKFFLSKCHTMTVFFLVMFAGLLQSFVHWFYGDFISNKVSCCLSIWDTDISKGQVNCTLTVEENEEPKKLTTSPSTSLFFHSDTSHCLLEGEEAWCDSGSMWIKAGIIQMLRVNSELRDYLWTGNRSVFPCKHRHSAMQLGYIIQQCLLSWYEGASCSTGVWLCTLQKSFGQVWLLL